MSLLGNGRNHNQTPDFDTTKNVLKNGKDYALKFNNEQREPNKPPVPEENVDFASPSKVKIEAQDGEKKGASAFDDLDDYVYRYSRKRHHKHHKSGILRKLGIHKSHRRKKKKKKSKFKTWQKVIISIICIILVIIIGLLGTILYLNKAGENALLNSEQVVITVPEEVKDSDNGGKYLVTKDGRKFAYNENITSILCMGVDKDDLELDNDVVGTAGAADFLFLITIDTATGESNLIHISRDTMAEIGIYSTEGIYVESREAQICLAYAYGDGKHVSCNNQVTAVRNLFYNVPINSYVSLDLSGVSVINDSIGGVTVTSPETIGEFTAGQQYHLQGKYAEMFVRRRSIDIIEGNSLRMKRQREYIQAFAQKVIQQTKEDIQTPITLFNTASPYICTNLDASKITYLAINGLKGNLSKEFEIKTLDGELKQGETYVEYYLDEEKFFETFLEVFYTPVE